MKILIAPDNFKTTLSAKQVIDVVKEQLLLINSSFQIDSLIMSDGGEGFLDCVDSAYNCEFENIDTIDADGNSISAPIAYNKLDKIGFIESAKIIGYKNDKHGNLNVRNRGTSGLGIIIDYIWNKFPGFKWYMGLGGTSTVDGGKDAATELGIRFLGKDEKILSRGGYSLHTLHKIEIPYGSQVFSNLDLTFVCDVDSPLNGKNGAVECYGPQKGINKDLSVFKEGFQLLAKKLGELLPFGFTDKPCYGSAGGIPATMETIFNWNIMLGSEFINKVVSLEQRINECDLVITGEGSFDSQSMNGKVVGNILNLAKSQNKPVLIIAGKASNNLPALPNVTIISTFPFGDLPTTPFHALNNLKKALSNNLKGAIKYN